MVQGRVVIDGLLWGAGFIGLLVTLMVLLRIIGGS